MTVFCERPSFPMVAYARIEVRGQRANQDDLKFLIIKFFRKRAVIGFENVEMRSDYQ